MKSQILQFVEDRIAMHDREVLECDDEISSLQEQFNSMADTREITLADIFSSRIGYYDYEEIDRELTRISEEIEDITDRLSEKARIDDDLRERRSEFKSGILDSMNRIRKEINNAEEVGEYSDLFTTTTSVYSGSEASEYFIARTCALAKHINHKLPIVIDSFRAEELSTLREERALELFSELPNQVILSATLKEQEAGKYDRMENVNQISFVGFKLNKLLSEDHNEAFTAKIDSFGVKLL